MPTVIAAVRRRSRNSDEIDRSLSAAARPLPAQQLRRSRPRQTRVAPGSNGVRSRLVWGFSCQAVVLGNADSFLFGAGKAVFRPVACNQVPGARGRGQGTETLAALGGLPPSVACVSQRLDA